MSASRLNNWNSSGYITAGFLLMHDTFHGMNKFVIGGPLMHTAIPLGWHAAPRDFSFTMHT